MKQQLQIRYAQLCQDLGHLYSNKKQIESRIAAVEAEIVALDNFSKMLPNEVEQKKKGAESE